MLTLFFVLLQVDETEVEDEFEQMVKEEQAKNAKAREEEEARQAMERMLELQEWEMLQREKQEKEKHQKEEPEKVNLTSKGKEDGIEEEVKKRTQEMADLQLA